MQYNIYFLSCTAAFVGFTNTSYSVMEAEAVEVGIELRGNLSFPIGVTVNVNFATATCKREIYTYLDIIIL